MTLFKNKNTTRELLFYLAIWIVLFSIPLLSMWVHSMADSNMPMRWHGVFVLWKAVGLMFVAFLIHNFFIAPYFVYKHKPVLYFVLVILLSCVFMGAQMFVHTSGRHHPAPPERTEMPKPSDSTAIKNMPLDEPEEMDMILPEGPRPQMVPPPKGHHHHGPRPLFDMFDFVMLAIMLFSLGTNIGAKLYFKNMEDKRRFQDLEKENLEQQLEYLRYQVNPHFLMNTLNNIHALVDIDPEMAKSSIVELSKMMRYVLYEGDNAFISLQREIEFLRHYASLMRLRYTDKVKITADVPETLPNVAIAPLLLVPFVENAFKHGVSYQQDSFIHIALSVEDGKIHCSCRNSKRDDEAHSMEQGGVGLSNVKRRLDLIYGADYSLLINDGESVYEVKLTLPAKEIDNLKNEENQK